MCVAIGDVLRFVQAEERLECSECHKVLPYRTLINEFNEELGVEKFQYYYCIECLEKLLGNPTTDYYKWARLING
jgi:hypothetical protein